MKSINILLLVGGVGLLTGCSGVELGGKIGAYRVDNRQESQSTDQRNTVPLACYFYSCKKTSELKFSDKDGGYYAK